ncbi:hypothetical protein BH10PLA2_BH10PLA2_34000 [soil metagenome]
MSQDLNNDPLISKLTQLTPATSTIDRDAMLFAAGRASAPRARGWQALAGALACSQAVMLAFWLVQPSPMLPGGQMAKSRFDTSAPLDVNRLASSPLPSDSYGKLMAQAASGEIPVPAPLADAQPSRSILATDLSSLNSLLD